MGTIDIQQLLTRLEELFDHGWKLPLGNKIAVDEETFYNIVEQMWISIPSEVKEAEEVQRERDRLITQAQEEARRIIAQAREEAARRLNEHDLRTNAKAQADAMLASAKEEAERITSGADQYAENTLRQLGEQVDELQRVIRGGLEVLAKQRKQSSLPSEAEEKVPEQALSEATTGQGNKPERS
ncbi:MAG: hypothetical protein A2Y73_01740 [Chloroflexi bacterium RBG_13_56_8]|nr:MAG: hypothetical protein A2Y73_01740 [Chloroflexi bacterium RBG_13_56_8]